MGVALGLGAALCWGLADYVAARAARAIGTLRVVLGFTIVATVTLAVVALASGALDDVGRDDLPFFAFVGVLGWGSYLAFYGALRIGPISIASPIVSGYAAVTVVLAVLILDERLSAWEWAAIVVSLLGVAAASADVRALQHGGAVKLSGILLALLAMALIGGFVFGVAYRTDELGWLAPILLARAFTLVFVAGQATVVRSLGFPDRRPVVVGALAALALLDTAGYICFNLGATVADTAVVGAASAPYAVVPIVAGVLFFHERPTPIQWTGIGLIVGGLVVLALASG